MQWFSEGLNGVNRPWCGSCGISLDPEHLDTQDGTQDTHDLVLSPALPDDPREKPDPEGRRHRSSREKEVGSQPGLQPPSHLVPGNRGECLENAVDQTQD